MTREEELQRYIEERDMLEGDLELEHQRMCDLEMEGYGEESDEWNACFDFITSTDNEIASLTSAIEELQGA